MDHQVIVIANSKSEEELNLQQDNNANDKVLSSFYAIPYFMSRLYSLIIKKDLLPNANCACILILILHYLLVISLIIDSFAFMWILLSCVMPLWMASIVQRPYIITVPSATLTGLHLAPSSSCLTTQECGPLATSFNVTLGMIPLIRIIMKQLECSNTCFYSRRLG